MEKIISSINEGSLKNETHVQFYVNIDDVFIDFDPAVQGFQLLYIPFKKSLTNEKEALDFIRKSELTKKIHDQDHIRDDIWRGFSDLVKGERRHFDPVHREAAELLYGILKHYKNIAKKTLDDETAAINDLLSNLNQPSYAQAVATLGLLPWQEKLREENAKFAELMKERYTETAEKTSLRMKTTRRETDKYYHAITSQIENLHLAGVVINEAFIKELNAVIDRYKHILAQEIGERKPKPLSNENDEKNKMNDEKK
jgi:hypothetical protein